MATNTSAQGKPPQTPMLPPGATVGINGTYYPDNRRPPEQGSGFSRALSSNPLPPGNPGYQPGATTPGASGGSGTTFGTTQPPPSQPQRQYSNTDSPDPYRWDWSKYQPAQPAVDTTRYGNYQVPQLWQGGYDQAGGTLGQGIGAAGMGLDYINRLSRESFDPSRVGVNPYDNTALQGFAGKNVLGQTTGDYGAASAAYKGILGGEDALFNANRLQILDDARAALANEQNVAGGQLAASGLGSSSLGVSAMNDIQAQNQRAQNEALLAARQQDLDARLQAGGLLNQAFGTQGSLLNTQAARQQAAQQAYGEQRLMGDRMGLEADMANQDAEIAARGLDINLGGQFANMAGTLGQLGMGQADIANMRNDTLMQQAGLHNQVERWNMGDWAAQNLIDPTAKYTIDRQEQATLDQQQNDLLMSIISSPMFAKMAEEMGPEEAQAYVNNLLQTGVV